MSILHLTVLLGYGVAAAALAFALRSDREGNFRIALSSLGVAAGLVAAMLHARHLWLSVVVPEGWLPSVPNVVSLFGWELGLLAVVAAATRELRAVAMPLFVLAGVGSLFTGISDPTLARVSPSPEIAAHMVLSLLAYGLLASAALVAVFLRIQDGWLRHGHVRGWSGVLPPLFVTERLLFTVLTLGWLLLTLALATGLIFLEDLFGQRMVHKSVLSVSGWVILTVLLAGHMRWGWRGRRTTYWMLGSFALLLLAYFGSKAVLEEILGRTWG